MEESSDLYDAYETNGPPQWPDHQDLDNVECLRRKVKYYFMNPCEKYHARGRKPWKLILQIIKIAVITIQVVMPDMTHTDVCLCCFTTLVTSVFFPRLSWCLLG